jgi:FAD-dependent urate hydroxylase
MRILVGGAGIGGLCFAVACREQGMALEVVERLPRIEPVGAGIVLHPNGMEVLQRLGLAQQVRDLGTVLKTLVIHEREEPLRLSFEEIWAGATQPSIAVARSQLHEVLLQRLGSDGVRLVSGISTLRGVGEQVEVTLEDGRREQCELLVAADGVHSSIRKALGLGEPRQLGLWYWRFCTSAQLVPEDEWHSYPASRGHEGFSFGFIPLGQGLTHVFVQQVSEAPPVSGQAEAEAWLQANAARLSPLLDRAWAARATGLHFGPAYELESHPWRSGRVAFLGDASHAIAPTFSEGGSLAMEDAVVLARELAKHQGSGGIDVALTAYEASRAERVKWAYRMAQQQVRSLRRAAPRATPAQAPGTAHILEYLRCLYRPLLTPP